MGHRDAGEEANDVQSNDEAHARETIYCKRNKKLLRKLFFCLFVNDVTEVTRSARKYCKTGATLGQGCTQAYKAPNRGLNNPLKLL